MTVLRQKMQKLEEPAGTREPAEDGSGKRNSSVRRLKAVAPRERAPERRREELIKSATKEFAANGYGGARIDRIVARTNSNKAMVYHYFGSKEKLYIAVLEEIYSDIRRREARIDFGAMEPVKAIERLVEFTFHYYIDNPAFVRMINNENQHKIAYLKRSNRATKMNNSIIEVLKDILDRGVACGVFRSAIDPTDLYISISALGFTYVANRYTLGFIFQRDLFAKDAIEARLKSMTDMILRTLRAL